MTKTAKSLSLLLLLSLPIAALITLPNVQAGKTGYPDFDPVRGTTNRQSGVLYARAADQSAPAGDKEAPAAPPSPGFTAPMRVGVTTEGDQWEPSIASDASGHVYILYPQYGTTPNCGTCPSPTILLQISANGGTSWGTPTQIAPPGSGQWDAQIAVDPADGRTVYAAWLQDNKSTIVVARSNDYGATWASVIANQTNASTDKPIIAVRGGKVYVAYNHAQKTWVSSSMNGGASFTTTEIRSTKLGWSLAGGGTVTPSGDVYYAWAGYDANGGATGDVNIWISKSGNSGQSWSTQVIDVSGSPPDCSAFSCGWAFLGPQMALASDANNTVYALWNSGASDGAAERMYFTRSTNGGNSWSTRANISNAPAGVAHAFPAIAATGTGDVRIAWMDARANGAWNLYYRRSTDGGTTWGNETDLSTYTPGYGYITADGFRFPFGDYYEIDLDAQGNTHLIWGEGFSYDAPGSIWYVKGR